MNDRLRMTKEEKMIAKQLDDATIFNMGEDNIQKAFEKEKAIEFNNQLDEFVNEYAAHNKELQNIADNMGVDPEKLEIKPTFNKILIKPFLHNPFQRIEIQNGIIVDTGGYRANIDRNPVTGKNEELDEKIKTAVVIEVGPTCQYLKQGDVIFYASHIVTPVPFFKQGLYCMAESNAIAVVNENLQERFDQIKNQE